MSKVDDTAVPVRERELVRDGRRLHLLEWGPVKSVSTVLAVHGGCANAHWWHASAQSLARDHRVIAVDLAGHGESDPIADGSYSLEGHRDDVCFVAEEIGLHGFALMGHSFGGFVSLACLPRLRDRLGALILVDTRGHVRRRSARYLNALSRFPNPTYASEEDARDAFQLLPRASSATDEVLDHVARRSICRAPDGSWSLAFDRRALRAAEEREFHAEIEAWSGPSLVIRGEHSTALSPRGLATLASELRRAETVEIQDAHHHVMLDQPQRFAQAVDRFLRAHLGSGEQPSGGDREPAV